MYLYVTKAAALEFPPTELMGKVLAHHMQYGNGGTYHMGWVDRGFAAPGPETPGVPRVRLVDDLPSHWWDVHQWLLQQGR